MNEIEPLEIGAIGSRFSNAARPFSNVFADRISNLEAHLSGAIRASAGSAEAFEMDLPVGQRRDHLGADGWICPGKTALEIV